MYAISAKFKYFFVAPYALEQNKSGPRQKKVGNHWFKPKHFSRGSGQWRNHEFKLEGAQIFAAPFPLPALRQPPVLDAHLPGCIKCGLSTLTHLQAGGPGSSP